MAKLSTSENSKTRAKRTIKPNPRYEVDVDNKNDLQKPNSKLKIVEGIVKSSSTKEKTLLSKDSIGTLKSNPCLVVEGELANDRQKVCATTLKGSNEAENKSADKLGQTAKGQICSRKEFRDKLRADKKINILYEVDCSEIREGNSVINVAELVKFIRKEVKVATVKVDQLEWKIVVTAEQFFKKPYLKYMVKKFLKKKKLQKVVHVSAVDVKTYKLQYYRNGN